MKYILATFVALLAVTFTHIISVNAQEAEGSLSGNSKESTNAETKSSSELPKPLNLQSMPLLQNQITTNTSQIATNTSQIAKLNTTIEELNSSVATLKARLSDAEQIQITTSKRLDNLEKSQMKSLVVVDANGKFVGYLIDLSKVYVPSSNKIVNLNFSDGTMTFSKDLMVAFSEYDCKGQAYSGGGGTTQGVINTNSDRYFESDGYERVSNINAPLIKSFLRNGTTCHSRQSNTWLGNLAGMYKVKEIQAPLELPLAGPLSVQAGL